MWAKLAPRLHVLLTLGSLSLVLTSPWIVIGRRLRPQASFLDLWHVYFGLALLPLVLLFLFKNCRQGQWRLYFPYLAGNFRGLVQDLSALFRGRLPVAGGAGLFSVIEGLLVVLLLACCITGVFWFAQQGASSALFWRSLHANIAVAFVVFLVLHVLFAALHIVGIMGSE
jgi:hypothetical protein